MVTTVDVARTPSLEPVGDAIIAAMGTMFDDAAAAVAELFPEPPITLKKPAQYQLIGQLYQPPRQFPALLIGASNLRRIPGDDEPFGGSWMGSIEVHIWLQDNDQDKLTRALYRYASLLWIALVSADASRQLGAHLMGGSLAISPYEDPNQTLVQRAIVVQFDVAVIA